MCKTSEKTNWHEQLSKNIDNQANAYLSIRDYRFYQIEKLKRIALLLQQQKNCNSCKQHKKELEQIVANLDRLINLSGANRSEYENRVEALIQHLKNEHQVYQRNHFTYTYSTYSILTGLALGSVLSFLIFQQFNATIFLTCCAIAILVGNIWGAKKDRICKMEKRQL